MPKLKEPELDNLGRPKLKRGTKIRILQFKGKVINPVHCYLDKKKIIAYRVTDSKRPSFWSVVPAYLVEEVEK